MNPIYLLTVSLFIMTYCNSPNKDNQVNDCTQNAECRTKEAHITGVYEGILPAADCEGIKTTLTFRDDTTYTLQSKYIGEADATFETIGAYKVIGDTIIELITPYTKENTYYKILSDKKVMLSDKEGNINHGPLAEYYILIKK